MKIKLKVATVVNGSVFPVGTEMDVPEKQGKKLLRQGKAEVVKVAQRREKAVRPDGEKAVQDVASIAGDGGTEGSS